MGLYEVKGVVMRSLLAASVVLITGVVHAGVYSGGDGTQADPYQINTAADWQQLMTISSDWSKCFCLTSDLDLLGINITPIGTPSSPFSGVFDGQDHTISHVRIYRPSSDYVALFGYIGSFGRVRRLNLVNVDVQGRYEVGGLAGCNYYGKIALCSVAGEVRGQFHVGGLVSLNAGTITSSHASVDAIASGSYVGGLVGDNGGGSILYSHTDGTINGDFYVGGLVGDNNIGTITCCYSKATVNAGKYIGGLVGLNRGQVDFSYAAGLVSRRGDHIGGLAGANLEAGMITSCFWDTDMSGQASSEGGTGRTTMEMMTLSTYTDADWDFTDTWSISEGADYPQLRPEILTKHYSGGSGTQANPYQIESVADWQELMDEWEDWSDNHFVLTSHLDLDGITLKPVGNNTVNFTGIFDGAGYTISNATLYSPNSLYVGLFGRVGSGGQINNLGVVNVNMQASGYVGGLAGFCDHGAITDCNVTGTVTGGGSVGGLVGGNSYGTITTCHTDATSSATGERVGALVGYNSHGTITSCYANGSTTGAGSGGLVGDNTGTIVSSRATGPVDGPGDCVGGLAGKNSGTITSSRAEGTVTGADDYAGGLVGHNDAGTLISCCAEGSVSGNQYVGGLVGNSSGTINDCNATGTVEGETSVGGLVGSHSGTMASSYATGQVDGTGNYVGGLTGWNSGMIDSCYSTGPVNGETNYVGGLVGYNSSSGITRCYCAGAASGSNHVGGLTGHNSGTLTACYAMGAVEGNDGVGGLAGTTDSPMSFCYATGVVIGDSNVGGLVGGDYLDEPGPRRSGTGEIGLTGNNSGRIASCFWDIQTTGWESSCGGRGLTTEQMKTLTVYQNAGWAGQGWVMIDGVDYPHLNWEGTEGSPIPAPGSMPLAGSGAEDDPYLVATEEDFALLSSHWLILDKHIKLTNDLDLEGAAVYPIGELGPFTGVFDGNGHTISHAVIHRASGDYVGLFSYISWGAEIMNLGVVDANVQGRDYTGGLVGYNDTGTINGCYVTGTICGRNCVGGLVGYECDLGRTIDSCYCTAAVSGGRFVGGLVGSCLGTIRSCYAAGPVSGDDDVGGLAGYSAYGSVIADFWDIETSGQVSSAAGMGKTTAEMKTLSTFLDADWDFLGTWTIQEGVDYPRLQWRPPVGTYSGGSGTDVDPYRIAATADLQELMTSPGDWDKHFVLMSNLDLAGAILAPVGSKITPFTGVFDGQGYSISNAVINRTNAVINPDSRNYVGLFGYVGPDGRVENLGLVNADMRGYTYVGGLVGYNLAGTIACCHATGDVNGGGYTGGLVGYNDSGKIISCYATADVSGGQYAGGLVGYNYHPYLGPAPSNGEIVTADYWEEGGEIISCYAKGSVNGSRYVGGLVGYNSLGWIDWCYAAGIVNGTVSNIGGLVGYGGARPSCFWDVLTSGQASSSGGVGKTTSQMQMIATFEDAGWDFVDTWSIHDGRTYPGLKWQSIGTYSGGSGTQTAPYKIRTAVDWQELTVTPVDWGRHFILVSNIDMNGVSLDPTGNDTTYFTGVVDGRGHVISNARIHRPDDHYMGLFGIIGPGGWIANLGLVNVDITGKDCTGGLAGVNWEGTIVSCYATGTVAGGAGVGGLVGYNIEGAITACHAIVAVSGEFGTGGLVGLHSGTITYCYAAGPVGGSNYAGGLVGYADIFPVYGSVESSFWDIETSGQTSSAGGTGKTTAEMKTLSTFTDADWDFVDTWGIYEGIHYPGLKWQPWGMYSGGSGTEEEPYVIETTADWEELIITSADWDKSFLLTADLDLTGSVLAPVGNDRIVFSGTFDGQGYAIGNAIISLPDSNYVGLFGLLGAGGQIQNLGVLSATIQGRDYVGTLVGYNHSGTLTGCYITGDVNGNEYVGGLTGCNNSGIIIACHTAGTASANSHVGGLVGWNYQGKVIHCYSTGRPTGASLTGGLCGNADTTGGCEDVENFWDIETSQIVDSVMGTGRTTSQMMMFTTFTEAGWDFVETWEIRDGTDYPRLQWEVRVPYAGGSGTSENPYRIAIPADWRRLMLSTEDWDKCFVLVSDVNLAGQSLTPVGNETDMFTGVFDGVGHRISGVVMNQPEDDYIGLFGYIGYRACVTNLEIVDVNVQGHSYVGGLTGYNHSYSTIAFCHITGAVTGNGSYVGGLAGRKSHSGEINSCSVAGIVSGMDAYVGGLVGYHDSGVITSCYVRGEVNGVKSNVGGLVGANRGTITSCCVMATVNGTEDRVGGLVGYNGWYDYNAPIIDSCATGAVHGRSKIGGLVGSNYYSTISFCYATGAVAGDTRVGGMVGDTDHGTLKSAYATGAVSGNTNSGGLVGYNYYGLITSCYSRGLVSGTGLSLGGLLGFNSLGTINNCFWDVLTSGWTSSHGGTGKTTVQMQMFSTYSSAGWDFADTWAICEGTNYPRLQWSISSADFLCPDGVAWEDFEYFCYRWLLDDCGSMDGCEGADLSGDGRVDLADFAILEDQWMNR